MNYNDFSCPLCKQKLEFHGELFKCSCGNTFNLLDDIPYFWVDNGKTREMDAYFDNVPEQYESVNYLSRIYQFFGGLATQPEDLMVPIINQGIQDGLNSILKPQHQSILDLACRYRNVHPKSFKGSFSCMGSGFIHGNAKTSKIKA
ncbi:hypothetical protein Metbo_1900 [Methanobacterium lacus]|uniref:Uncharacterized protein n=1 Tax=Methanobacterium lacus (strain AL-21) TaxID=877455 RepID=F0TAP8_METLA|nr:hypothetical protein [Methanobacterium lacus]ADZ10120.1 hypothetical protein Metbo_1900 [Methanobacterium lacus]